MSINTAERTGSVIRVPNTSDVFADGLNRFRDLATGQKSGYDGSNHCQRFFPNTEGRDRSIQYYWNKEDQEGCVHLISDENRAPDGITFRMEFEIADSETEPSPNFKYVSLKEDLVRVWTRIYDSEILVNYSVNPDNPHVCQISEIEVKNIHPDGVNYDWSAVTDSHWIDYVTDLLEESGQPRRFNWHQALMDFQQNPQLLADNSNRPFATYKVE